MENKRLQKLKTEIKNLHRSVSILKELFNSKHSGFTLDGRLVGDIGEVIAEELFQIKLHTKLVKYYDAITLYEPELNVQIKATFKESLTYNHQPDYYIGIKMNENGEYKVIYNGPGKYIHQEYSHRKGIGEKLLSFPIKKLEEISSNIHKTERIRMRDSAVTGKIKVN
ncbi:MAG: hypothetical protein NXI23_16810 [Bacteroidetes bacterium]|jgi:hypothetical protein|nr:hypothetical protein [Bacteroidota bacterium]